jgi:hypothetical protein
VVYFKLCFNLKNVTWDFFDYKRFISWEFPFFITSHMLLILIVFAICFQISWAFLGIFTLFSSLKLPGMFLDPHWAIPLVTIYGAIAVHIIIWGQRLYVAVSPLKMIVTSEVVKQALAWIIKRELANEHVKDIKQSPLFRFIQFLIVNNKDLELLDHNQVNSIKLNITSIETSCIFLSFRFDK